MSLKVTLARQGRLGCSVFSGLFIHSLSGVSKNRFLMENIIVSSSTFCSVLASVGWMLLPLVRVILTQSTNSVAYLFQKHLVSYTQNSCFSGSLGIP